MWHGSITLKWCPKIERSTWRHIWGNYNDAPNQETSCLFCYIRLHLGFELQNSAYRLKVCGMQPHAAEKFMGSHVWESNWLTLLLKWIAGQWCTIIILLWFLVGVLLPLWRQLSFHFVHLCACVSVSRIGYLKKLLTNFDNPDHDAYTGIFKRKW